jgi:hypothetical protein
MCLHFAEVLASEMIEIEMPWAYSGRGTTSERD